MGIISDLRFWGEKKKWPKGLEPVGDLCRRADEALCGMADEVTKLRTTLSYAALRVATAEAEKTGLLQSLQHHTGCDHGVMAIRMLVDRAEAAEQREKDATAKALEHAAKVAEGNYDHIGVQTKHDRCPHGKFGWEDCDQCVAAAIRAIAEVQR